MNPVDFALEYAARGWTVMPLRRGDNIPHPMLRKGWTFGWVGTTNPNLIRSWWSDEAWWRWWPWTEHVKTADRTFIDQVHDPGWENGDPAANVGVVGGRRSRLLVLDVDMKKGNGIDSIRRWDRGEELLALETARSNTPSGGVHVWFSLPEDLDIRRKVGWLPNVDACGSGGLIAAPPSCRHVTIRDPRPFGGSDTTKVLREYEWSNTHPVIEAPRWLIDDVMLRRATATHVRKNPIDVEGRSPKLREFLERGFGWYSESRNKDCYIVARQLWALGLSEHQVLDVVLRCLDQTNVVVNRDGKYDEFSEEEAYQVVRSAGRYVTPEHVEAVETLKAWVGE